MPTYLYFCPTHQEFEFVHSINDKLEECPKCKEEGKNNPIVRLINTQNGFVLNGSGWARDSYSK